MVRRLINNININRVVLMKRAEELEIEIELTIHNTICSSELFENNRTVECFENNYFYDGC